jgi:ATP-dependent DNA ligase
MLAQLGSRLPVGERWRYEPKLDGFRGLLWRRRDDRVQLLSRNSRDLGPWFPEITRAAAALPPGTLLDGEIVMCDEAGATDFGRLQERLATARTKLAASVREHTAVLVVFDILERSGAAVAHFGLEVRRRELEACLDGVDPCLQLVTQTHDVELARDWLRWPLGEGVVATRLDRPYCSGRTGDWVKVKRHRSVDCVVIGVAGDPGAPKLVLGLRHADDQVHHFAITRPIPPEHTGPLGNLIAAAGEEQPAIRSRWQHDAIPPWRRIPAVLVCEARVTNLDAGRWARFPAVFLRWRLDRSPDDCNIHQLLA